VTPIRGEEIAEERSFFSGPEATVSDDCPPKSRKISEKKPAWAEAVKEKLPTKRTTKRTPFIKETFL